jgi:hypothetical protein
MIGMQPLAFRIFDYRSISDSGWCDLSPDGITVLAGENEAGKSAILTALRDFDVAPGVEVASSDYIPEGRVGAKPRVLVRMRISAEEVDEIRKEFDSPLPEFLFSGSKDSWELELGRDLTSNEFFIDKTTEEKWGEEVAKAAARSDVLSDESTAAEGQVVEIAEFLRTLHKYWPQMIYMDSASSILPRSVRLSQLLDSVDTRKRSEAVNQSVIDFLSISELDPKEVRQASSDPKRLRNYLSARTATITADFVKFWRQKQSGDAPIQIQVESSGIGEDMDLVFFVNDGAAQYPDQRSQGFRWFLGFFLRLTAEGRRRSSHKVFFLIDEPGSHLHARAQRDVLHLFEQRVATDDFVLYATHSPTLLPPKSLYRIRVVLRRSGSGTRVYDRLTHPDLVGPAARDALSPLVASIGFEVSESLGLANRRVLLVEGISDVQYVRGFERVTELSLPEDVAIVPCLGVHTIEVFAAILLGFGVPFAILLDRDRAGDTAETKVKKKLALDDSRIVKVPDGVTIEDVLSPADFDKVLNASRNSMKRESKESPSGFIKRTNADKVLMANSFAVLCEKAGLAPSEQTVRGAKKLLAAIRVAIGEQR